MDTSLLVKYNKPGPRYTSYPPATFFHENITEEDYLEMLKQSNDDWPSNISVYLHIPFCPQLCHFCGCNTSCFPSEDRIEAYIDALEKEIETVSRLIDTSRPLTQIHWGGGTPNSIDFRHIERIMELLLRRFTPTKKAEIAMECNPAYLQPEDIDRLAAMGFNRLSLGIQDFNDEVLRLVNRKPSMHPISLLTERMKKNRMDGVNIDLIYGLPGQTPENFRETIQKAIDIAPDRLVTFSYAHVPWVKSAQKLLEDKNLPNVEEKLALFKIAWEMLTEAGYQTIGMDHYAKAGDELAIAKNSNLLHRNFQGYCTLETTGQVYAFGATSISQLQKGYFQNEKDTEAYIRKVNDSGLALKRGYILTHQDMVVRAVINEIMCNGRIHFPSLADKLGVSLSELKSIIDYQSEKLKPYQQDNLLEISTDEISLKGSGLLVVRNIAMEFDPRLDHTTGMYSKTV